MDGTVWDELIDYEGSRKSVYTQKDGVILDIHNKADGNIGAIAGTVGAKFGRHTKCLVDLKIELTFSIEAYASSHLDQYRPKIISATNGDVESILRAVARGSTRLWSLFLALCRVFNGSIFSLIQCICTSVFDR
jgi:hypothetical protein